MVDYLNKICWMVVMRVYGDFFEVFDDAARMGAMLLCWSGG